MIFATLCLQSSLLFAPLHLTEDPPELRAVQHIVVLHDELEGLGRMPARTPEQARELADDLVLHLDAGAAFAMLADRYSDAGPGKSVLGSFVQGALAPELDEFLFTAELGAHSTPITTDGGILILRRIETHAAVRMIRIDGQDESARAQAAEIAKQLEEGKDFGALATEHSDDAVSAAREGRYAVFERGPRDVLLKAAAFALDVGEWAGPLETPLGSHFLLREDSAAFPADLWEANFVRVRTILIGHALAEPSTSARTVDDALTLATSLADLLEAGRSFGELASQFDEDEGGKQRRGDLGWIHRRSPELPGYLRPAFLLEVGKWLPPQPTTLGYVLVLREE